METKKKNILQGVDLLKYIKLCIKSWKVFVIAAVACAGLALAYSVWHTPTVNVEAQLMLKDDAGGGGMMMLGEMARSFSLGDMFGGSSTTDNEASIIRSHSVFLKTVKQLDLNVSYLYPRLGVKWTPMPTTSPITMKAPASVSDTISFGLEFNLDILDNGKCNIECKCKRKVVAEADGVALPYDFTTPYGTFTFDTTKVAADAKVTNVKRVRVKYSSYAAAADAYAKLVKVFVPDRKTDFIGISMETVDPKFSIAIIDSLIANYTDVGNDYKIERSRQSLELVNSRLASLEQEMLMSETSLEDFKKTNKLTDVEVDASYLMSKTGEIEGGLLKAQTNLEVIKMTRDFINNPENNYALIPDLYTTLGVSGEGGGSQINAYNQLILQRMDVLSSAKPNSTTVKRLDDQIDALRENIVTSVNRMYENARVQFNELKAENGKTQSRLGQLPTLERQYVTLLRDRTLQNQMYLFLLQQREELNMSLASRSLPAQIIDPPHVLADKPLSKKILVAIAAFLGLLAAAAYVFFFVMPKSALGKQSEFESSNTLPLLGTIKPAGKTDNFIALDEGNANAETFRQLRSEVQQALASCGGNSVLVTSLHQQEGKTYVAVNLACALARLGKRVLLVDAALRFPTVAQALGIANPTAALADFVASGTGMPEISEASGDGVPLDVVTAAASNFNASDVLGSQLVADFIAKVKAEYDYVVVDSSSIDGYSDTSYLTALTDITLVVCRAGKVNTSDIDRLAEYLNQGRYQRLAAVANGFK